MGTAVLEEATGRVVPAAFAVAVPVPVGTVTNVLGTFVEMVTNVLGTFVGMTGVEISVGRLTLGTVTAILRVLTPGIVTAILVESVTGTGATAGVLEDPAG